MRSSKELQILYISSCPPSHFAGIGADYVRKMNLIGCSVDYLTLYQEKTPYVIGLFPTRQKNRVKYFFEGVSFYIRRYLPFLSCLLPKPSIVNDRYIRNNDITIVNPYEDKPPVDVDIVLGKITKEYDFVAIHCWQDMLSAITIKAIYDKLKVPILLSMYDMSPITGGCHYFKYCENFKKGCGNCPGLNSHDEHDQSWRNVNIKRSVYSSINCSISANSYTKQFALMSGLFNEDRIDEGKYTLDETVFRPYDVHESRKLLKIPSHKTFVLFARYAGRQHNITKGYDYLVESVNIFYNKLSSSEQSKSLLLLAGSKDTTFEKTFEMDVYNVGLLDRDKLIRAYSASSVFLSSSVNDAGPSMVNQAEACGTPVVAFDIGSACYMVDNGKTGYRVKLKDVDAFSQGIMDIFCLTDESYLAMRKNCRQKALEECSLMAGAQRTISRYEKLLKEQKM